MIRRAFMKMGLLSAASVPLMGKTIFPAISTVAEGEDSGMNCIGLLGGTSWHSTIDYYRYINQMVNDVKGERVNPPLLLDNLNQRQINDLQDSGKWDAIADIYTNAGTVLAKAGAKALVLCANTAHAVYDKIYNRLPVPILHIA